jgi:hypothetical protein
MLGSDAGSNIGCPTGGKWNNQRDGASRISLSPTNARHNRQSGSARCQMQKLATGKFHDVSSKNLEGQALLRLQLMDLNYECSPAAGTNAATEINGVFGTTLWPLGDRLPQSKVNAKEGDGC